MNYPLGEVVEPPAFSNGESFRYWEANYCERCVHDKAYRQDKTGRTKGCELIAEALLHLPVPAWVYVDKPYPLHVHCLKFSPDDGQPPTYIPRPTPQVPGQLDLFQSELEQA